MSGARNDELYSEFAGNPELKNRPGPAIGLVRACGRIERLEAELVQAREVRNRMSENDNEDMRPEDSLTIGEQREIRRFIRAKLSGESIDRMKTPKWLLDLEEENEQLQAELAQARERERWVPVSERLPEHTHLVLTFGTYGALAICWYRQGRWINAYDTSFDMTGVTHWQPLPAPPAQEEGTE